MDKSDTTIGKFFSIRELKDLPHQIVATSNFDQLKDFDSLPYQQKLLHIFMRAEVLDQWELWLNEERQNITISYLTIDEERTNEEQAKWSGEGQVKVHMILETRRFRRFKPGVYQEVFDKPVDINELIERI